MTHTNNIPKQFKHPSILVSIAAPGTELIGMVLVLPCLVVFKVFRVEIGHLGELISAHAYIIHQTAPSAHLGSAFGIHGLPARFVGLDLLE